MTTVRKSLSYTKISIAITAALFLAKQCFALADGGQNALDFLQIVPDAQTVSMGGNSTAITSDRPSACFNNPATLAGIDRDELSFYQASYPAGLNYCYAGLGLPGISGNVAVSFAVMNYTGVDSRDNNGFSTAMADSYDALVTVGYAIPIVQQFPYYREYGAIGINAKFLESKLSYFDSEALAIDCGFIYYLPFSQGFTLGVALKNYGSDVKYVTTSYPLPTSLNCGLGYKSSDFENITAAIDYNMPQQGDAYYSAGISLKPLHFLKLNAGYRNINNSLFTGFCTGVGLEFGHFKLDYAFTPVNDLSPVQYISLSCDIGNIVKARTASDYYLDKHFREAAWLYHEGDLIEARREFEEILSIYPGHEPSKAYLEKIEEKSENESEKRNRKIYDYIQKANAAIANKDFITAKRYYNYVVSLNPDDEETRLGIEKIWKSMEDAKYEESREVYRTEIENLWNSAKESYKKGDYVEAKEYYKKILKIDPMNQDAKNAAVEMDSQLTRIAVGEINDLYAKGMEYYNKEQYKEALNYFDAVALAAPNREDATGLAAKCREAINDQEQKQKEAQLALDQKKNKPEMDRVYDKALSFYEKQNYDAALEYFKKGEEIAVKYQFTKYLENINRYKETIGETLSDRHYKAGFTLFRNNKYEAAGVEYRKALKYNPDNLEARTEIEQINKELSRSYYEKGMDYFSHGDTDKAREMFQKSLEYEPDKLESKRALERVK